MNWRHSADSKRCNKYELVKSLDQFSVNKSSRDGLRSMCRECSRQSGRKHYQNNREELREKHHEWSIANRDKRRAGARRRRARRYNAEGSDALFDEMTQLKKQRGKCYYCGCRLKQYHVDHVVPLSRGGSDHPDNKVLACSTCNLRKGSKLPHEWMEGGRLL